MTDGNKSHGSDSDSAAAVAEEEKPKRTTTTRKKREAEPEDSTAEKSSTPKSSTRSRPKIDPSQMAAEAEGQTVDEKLPPIGPADRRFSGSRGNTGSSGRKRSPEEGPEDAPYDDRLAKAEAKAREAEARARRMENEEGGTGSSDKSRSSDPADARLQEAEAKLRRAEALMAEARAVASGQQRQGGGHNKNRHNKTQGRKGGYQQDYQSGNRNKRSRRGGRNRKGGGYDDYKDRGDRDRYQDRPRRRESSDEPVRDPGYADGIIEISGKGFGFLREPGRSFDQSLSDVFVTPELIRKHGLRDGMRLAGETRKGNRGLQLGTLDKVDGKEPGNYTHLPHFEELTALNPNQRVIMETEPGRVDMRIVDMMTPIGKGQRGLIVAPPRSGKTTLLQHMAESVTKNHPQMPLIILLIDERPEEVTELRRMFPNAEIMASSNDSDTKSHVRIAQLAIERAKRLVEQGKDVFMLLDSITRMARAFNNATTGGGKTGSGGIDLKAMEIPRRIFAGARNTAEAGSLTIIASCLIETGSRMDDYIFQEFKGTGNMEIVLDRKISDNLIFPAIDIFQSGTRREELILPEYMLDKINLIRRGLSGVSPAEAVQRLIMLCQKFDTNFELLKEIKMA